MTNSDGERLIPLRSALAVLQPMRPDLLPRQIKSMLGKSTRLKTRYSVFRVEFVLEREFERVRKQFHHLSEIPQTNVR